MSRTRRQRLRRHHRSRIRAAHGVECSLLAGEPAFFLTVKVQYDASVLQRVKDAFARLSKGQWHTPIILPDEVAEVEVLPAYVLE